MSTHIVYADRASLAKIVGQPTGQDDRLDLALVMASRWVDRVIGGPEVDPPLNVPVEPPLTLTVEPVDAGMRQATLVAAARFLRSPDVPFGVAGGMGDLAVRIYADIPEAELHLLGLRQSWGVG